MTKSIQELMKILYPKPAVRFEVDDDFISLFPQHGFSDGYNIERSRCNTPEKIIAWAEHLSPKCWVDKQALVTFVLLAFDLIDVEPDRSLG